MYVSTTLLTLTLATASLSLAQDHKTIYVDKMEGLESYVEQALRDAELPFDFIEEQTKPDLKATLSKMHADYGEILYKHKLGRNETHHLELVDLTTKKVIARHTFKLEAGDASRKSAAADFASKVKKAYVAKSTR
jgi:hypothetical protein